MTRSAFLVALPALLLSGCAVTGVIAPVASSKSEFEGAVFQGESVVRNPTSPGGTEYRLYRQAATGFVPLQAMVESVEAQAEKYCAQHGKAFMPLRQTNTVPPYILGNFPRVELTFECLEDRKEAAKKAGDRYANLGALKKLLDDGALSREEFEREKAKILGAP